MKSIKCNIIKAGRGDVYGRPFAIGQIYTGPFDYVRQLVSCGYATVDDAAVFDDDSTPQNSEIAIVGKGRMAVEAELNEVTGGIELSGEIYKSANVIHLNAKYGVKPGDDITAALQDAINTIANSGQSGKIVIGEVGIYRLDGPLQTGSFNGAGAYADYSWAGQVLFPAVPFFETFAPSITIEGAVVPSGGWSTTGKAQGVIIKSSITSGYMIDTVPGFERWDSSWTGIMPIIRNLIFQLPDNPTAGAINIGHALRGKIESVAVLPETSWIYPASGDVHTAVAITLPQMYDNSDISVRDVNVRGFPTAFRFSEHATFDNVQIVGCRVGFISARGGNHANWFGYVTVEEVETIFFVEAGADHAIAVYGFLDNEVNDNWPFMNLVRDDSGTNQITGSIAVAALSEGSLGIVGNARGLHVENPYYGQQGGWKNAHPVDNFARCMGKGLPNSSGGAPGYSFPSFHPWRVITGGFNISAVTSGVAKMNSTGSSSYAAVPALNGDKGGCSRSITGVFNIAAGNNAASFGIGGSRNYNTNNSINLHVKDNIVYLGVGAFNPGNGTVTASGLITAGSQVKLRLDIVNIDGKPRRAVGYVNGSKAVSLTLTNAQAAALVSSTTAPYLEDMITFGNSDSTTTIQNFLVTELLSQHQPNSGSANLVAGSLTVADTNITAASIVRVFRQAAGGTLGHLSVSLTAGTGFTITSSSGTDTGAVYWEVVSY